MGIGRFVVEAKQYLAKAKQVRPSEYNGTILQTTPICLINQRIMPFQRTSEL
jgi:hypothetical protein